MKPTNGVLAAILLLATACGGSSAPTLPVEVDESGTCEILDSAHCLLPFPSNFFTRTDEATDSGLRIDFRADSLLQNSDGVRMDPREWNRNDGFSPGALIAALLPGLDADTSGLPSHTDLARSLDEDAGVVLLDVDAGERVPFWAELDASFPDGEEPLLLIRPARALREGHRHIVALRSLKDAGGAELSPSEVFRAYRDDLRTDSALVEERRPAMEAIFADLESAGVARASLQLAWDFTIASARSLSERLLHIRDDAFARLGDEAPTFQVDSTADAGTVTIVQGTFEAPLYLTGDGSPGSVFNDEGGDSLPSVNGTRAANFVCTVPKSASAENLARLFLFGHGLLGDASQTAGLGTLGGAVNIAFCGADWIGMASEDVPNVAGILGDLDRFREQADRLQQGHLEFLFLGRLMRHPAGFASHPAFRNGSESSVLDTSDLFFLGASQGGILGGATTAVAQDWTRGVMAVGAANYSLLIPRSIDFDAFAGFLADAYPSALDRKIGFGLIQMLWDRGEANGYLQHLGSDPYPDTPEHEVLYFEAFADHQVANLGTEYAARTIGAHVREPALRAGRGTAAEDFWGLDPIPAYPFGGDALVVWDFGTPAPPVANLPPREGEDPHGKASDVPSVLILISEYLKTGGGVVDVCAGAPCVTE